MKVYILFSVWFYEGYDSDFSHYDGKEIIKIFSSKKKLITFLQKEKEENRDDLDLEYPFDSSSLEEGKVLLAFDYGNYHMGYVIESHMIED